MVCSLYGIQVLQFLPAAIILDLSRWAWLTGATAEVNIVGMLSTDRERGILLGLVIGDAIGAAIEFKRHGTFVLVSGYRGGGSHGMAPGEWTDDTSMALALAHNQANAAWNA